MGMGDLGRLGHRLNDAGLVIGQHERYQRRPAVARQHCRQRRKVDHAGARHRNDLGLGCRLAHRIMLDCRDQDARPPAAAERQRVGFACAPLVKTIAGAGAPMAPATCSRASSIRRRARTAMAVHRGRIAADGQRRCDGRRRLRADRHAGVVIHVDGRCSSTLCCYSAAAAGVTGVSGFAAGAAWLSPSNRDGG